MRFLPLLLTVLLLSGCTANSPSEAVMATEPVGYYAPDSPLEMSTQGALRVYPLEETNAYGLRPFGEDLLLFAQEETTCLTVLTGDQLIPKAQLSLPFVLSAQDPSIQLFPDGMRYFDPTKRELVLLDSELNIRHTIAAPEDLVGTPLLSADGNTLYYCTANAVRAWDLESGIRRCIKDMAYEVQSVTGLHCSDSVIQCTITDNGRQRTLFLSAEDGRSQKEFSGDIHVETVGNDYYAVFPNGSVQGLAFGAEEGYALTPRVLDSETFFLPNQRCAVSLSEASMEYYRLSDGRRTAAIQWESDVAPDAVCGSGGYVYLLTYEDGYGCPVILRWDLSRSAVSDDTCYTGPYYSAEHPDEEGLLYCQTYANLLGQRYGIQIKVGKAAAAAEPWDYDFESEYLVPVLENALRNLEQQLSHYPEQVLSETAAHFSSLTICLVRSITGSPESGSLDMATGVQFFDGTDAYVAIAMGEYAQQAFYHELFHAMETHLLTRPTALDRWEELNPNGFKYDYSYLTNKNREAGIYLRQSDRAFIDTYSMSYPKEDKARVMEYAMLPGMDALFQSPIMQAKLRALSDGIREGFDLEDCEEVFLWEQYLE